MIIQLWKTVIGVGAYGTEKLWAYIIYLNQKKKKNTIDQSNISGKEIKKNKNIWDYKYNAMRVWCGGLGLNGKKKPPVKIK